ncbi:MAG TPA: LytTR family DNA-binding domain-containing protein [Caulobacteraceae bacterium]|nr:LytTR family DNA-binding domain-containing protein [Caulobacteraceae bacterium]
MRGFRLTVGAWALAVALTGLVTFVNVMTILDDDRHRGVHTPLALPLTLEITSAIAALASLFIVVVALRIAPPGRGPWWRTLAVHALGTLAFSLTHVTLMTLLRIAIFAASGHHYEFSLSELPYEYRKDLLSYLVIGGIFWLVERERERQRAAAAGEPERELAAGQAGAAGVAGAAGPATFDIRDGASILRVPVGEILAAQAAGNYVEFALEDGRRPLMRASMAAVEIALAPHGFVRTHRSWLVNAARVRALTAAGSGDFRLDLGCGLTAPLSRRYPAALARLKGER